MIYVDPLFSAEPRTAQAGSAVFSPCRKYRYILWRRWGADWDKNYAMFIGLNPSTADETLDDPTIRRCVGYAKAWGYSGLCMANLFAYRATDPKDMLGVASPVGEENDAHLLKHSEAAGIVIAAWGNHGTHGARHLQVKRMISNLHCLKITKTGMPGHPLYLSKELKPILFDG